MSSILRPRLLVGGHVAHAPGLGAWLRLARLAKPPFRGRLPRRLAIKSDVALQHWQQTLAVGRVAGLDDEIQDQAASAGGQIYLVAAIDIATALDDDIGTQLEEAYQFLAGGHRLAAQDPPLGLGDDLLDQRPVVADGGLPEFARRARRQGQLRRRLVQIGQGFVGILSSSR